MYPRPIVSMDVPTRPADLSQRLHNRFVKEAVAETLEEHHRRHTRKHFQYGNNARYGHYRRSSRYLRRKERLHGHRIDLVYSGQSRREVSSAAIKVRIGGAAEGGKKGITGSFRLRFPFAGRDDGKNRTVALLGRMNKELSRWSDDEAEWARQEVSRRYWAKVEAYRGSRKRIGRIK